MAMIIIAKHRNGAVGDVLLRFKGKYTRFEDADENASYPLPGESAAGGFPQIGGDPITDADIPLPPDVGMGSPFPPGEGGIVPF